MRIAAFAPGILVLALAGCGGGGGNGGGTNAPGFTVSLSSPMIVLTQGGSAQNVQVSVAGQNGFLGSVSITVNGLPNGVSAAPDALSLAAGSSASISFTATKAAAEGTTSFQVRSVSGATEVSTALSVTVKAVPGFALSINPGILNLAPGGSSQTFDVTSVPQGGFTGTIALTPAGLPPGVTVTPASTSVVVGDSAMFSVTAASTAPPGQASVSVQGVSGSLAVNTALSITVSAAPIPVSFIATGGLPQHGFYDSARHLLFATNPSLNEVDVISVTRMQLQARVPVPSPWGIDQMSDGKTLVVGTNTQAIYALDEDTLAVTGYPIPNVEGFMAGSFLPNLVAMANGKVILAGQEQGVSHEYAPEGAEMVVEWDSNANTFTELEPATPRQSSWAGVNRLVRSADHKWAAFFGDLFYLYSSGSDSLTSISGSAIQLPTGAAGFDTYSLNADGSKIAFRSGTSIGFLDRGFNLLGVVQNVPGGAIYGHGMEFSADGSRVYELSEDPTAILEVDVASCDVSTGCPFDLTARSWFCDESALPEGSNGLSPECPTDQS